MLCEELTFLNRARLAFRVGKFFLYDLITSGCPRRFPITPESSQTTEVEVILLMRKWGERRWADWLRSQSLWAVPGFTLGRLAVLPACWSTTRYCLPLCSPPEEGAASHTCKYAVKSLSSEVGWLAHNLSDLESQRPWERSRKTTNFFVCL